MRKYWLVPVCLAIVLLLIPDAEASYPAGYYPAGYYQGSSCYTPTYNYSSGPYYQQQFAPTYTPYNNVAVVAVFPFIAVPAASYTVGLAYPNGIAAVQQVATSAQVVHGVQGVQGATVGTAGATPGVLAGTSASPNANEILNSMLVELKALRAENKLAVAEHTAAFRRLEGLPPAAAPKKEEAPLPKENSSTTPKLSTEQHAQVNAALAILRKPLAGTQVSCQTCHSSNQPAEKSADLHLFDAEGQSLRLKDDQYTALTRKISKERKCPGAPAALTGADKETVLRVLPPLN